jgi:hypothetical protein
VICTHDKAKHVHNKLVLSSEGVLNNDYDHKGSVEKKTLVMSLMGLGTKMDWL